MEREGGESTTGGAYECRRGAMFSWLPVGVLEVVKFFAFFLRSGEIFVAFTPGEIGEISHPNYRPTTELCLAALARASSSLAALMEGE